MTKTRYVEIWLEKDALAGVLVDVTSRYDVPLMVTRGYPSMSFLHSGGRDHRRAEETDVSLLLRRPRSERRRYRPFRRDEHPRIRTRVRPYL